ncbi:MAG: D-2-hydroxyacid dehydrogenase family protein [Deltaproteobacteria bacterium]|nr:D-2-hydroxyacid dehydrogenase family protein [Deltaproteobacteria bacterium]
MKIVIPDDFDRSYQGNPDVERLRRVGEVGIYTTRPEGRAAMLDRLRGADIIVGIRERTLLDAEALGELLQLQMVSVTGTGVPHIDLNAATKQGIVVTNTPGESAPSVAELTFGLMIGLSRQLPAIDREIRQGGWPEWVGHDLYEKRLGVVGLGEIGEKVARLGQAFGMDVVAWGPTLTDERARRHGVAFVTKSTLFATSDYVTVHLRLAEETRRLITARELALMKPSAYFINTARAAVVDNAALLGALREGRIAGAALDVHEQEPLPADSPWRQLDNVVLVSHRGWLTHETLGRFMRSAVDNVLNFLHGKPTNVVNEEVLLSHQVGGATESQGSAARGERPLWTHPTR